MVSNNMKSSYFQDPRGAGRAGTRQTKRKVVAGQARKERWNVVSLTNVSPSDKSGWTLYTNRRILRSIRAGADLPTSLSLTLPLLGKKLTEEEEREKEEVLSRVRDGRPMSDESNMPILGIAGGGIFFFWEIGVLKYLEENFNLRNVEIIGVSAGALCAVLVASGVSLDRAVKKAYDISLENDIWGRPGGLAGIWGSLVRQWLEDLLPEDAHLSCNAKVKIIATRVPSMRLEYLDSFDSRSDLIDACMASVHIPFFLDGNGTYVYRGKQYIDGSVWDFFSGSNSNLLTKDGKSCIIDYFMDDQLEFSRLDFIKISSYEAVLKLVKSGYSFAERMDARGVYKEKLGERKWIVQRFASKVFGFF